MAGKKKKPEELELFDYLVTLTDKVETSIRILDRILPDINTKYEDELRHIRDDMAQVTQIGIILKAKHVAQLKE